MFLQLGYQFIVITICWLYGKKTLFFFLDIHMWCCFIVLIWLLCCVESATFLYGMDGVFVVYRPRFCIDWECNGAVSWFLGWNRVWIIFRRDTLSSMRCVCGWITVSLVLIGPMIGRDWNSNWVFLWLCSLNGLVLGVIRCTPPLPPII